MTIYQAIAILDAERVLQTVGCCDPKSAWIDFVQEAGRIIKGNAQWCNAFTDLNLLDNSSDPIDDYEGPECPGCIHPGNCDDCEYVIDVVFLRDHDGIYAVFPGLAATDTLVTCYSHVGQHSGCALWYCDDCEEVTDPAKYADLAAELGCKYNLHVVSKDCLYDAKYLAARAAQLRGTP